VKNKYFDLFDILGFFSSYKIELPNEYLPIENTCNLVSSEDIFSSLDYPEKNRSKMDGYAFDIKSVDISKKIKIVGFLGANETFKRKLEANECVKCSTGSNLNNNLNTIVPVEYCIEKDGYIFVDKDFNFNDNYIEKRGSVLKKGELILGKNSIVDHRIIERFALNRLNCISVRKKPNIAVISTGSEITETFYSSNAIINSNYYMISSFLKSKDVPFSYLGVVKDRKEDIVNIVSEALKIYDVVMTFGGTALGEKDLLKNVINDLNGKLLFDGVNASPGKTFKFAVVGSKPMFIFPGNPASASICIELFFDIFLNNIYYEEKYRLIDATAKFSLNKKKGFYKLIPGFFEIDGDKIMFFDRSTKYNKRKLGFAIAVIKKEQESLKSGETIKIYTSL
jgi:molybdopterin molybdotransferase